MGFDFFTSAPAGDREFSRVLGQGMIQEWQKSVRIDLQSE